MWVGTLIQEFNSVESDISYLISLSKQKLLFDSIKKINESYKLSLEIPSVSLEYILEDQEDYFVYIDNVREYDLEKVITLLSHKSQDNIDGSRFFFKLDEFKPYFLEISYNQNFLTEGYQKNHFTSIENSLKEIEIICLYYLSKLDFRLQNKKDFNTFEKCLKFLEDYKNGKFGRYGIDLDIKIKHCENNIFSILKEFKIEGDQKN